MIICLCSILSKCIDIDNKQTEVISADIEFEQFTGSAKCANCHKSIYDSFVSTGHCLTSQPVTQNNIKGSFEKGKNIYHDNPDLSILMEKTDSGLYQVEYLKGIKTLAQRLDISIGSGVRGQTYLSWQNNYLYQLPVSYLTSINSWVNSPGNLNHIVFNRPINSKCLECHTTYAKVISDRFLNTEEEIDHHKILYGITCEKCHGPGAKHAEYQTENPSVTTGKFIINPGKFTRQQSLDLCTLCHGGRNKNIKPNFSFKAGDKLTDYFVVNTSSNNNLADVHGNQAGLLAKSKCFRTSLTMTCLSCHNPHNDNRGNMVLFSQKCMVCHNIEHGTFCKINTDKTIIKSNCIDCHMPKQISKTIVFQNKNSKMPAEQLLRTHFISIYTEATKNFLSDKTLK